MMVKVSLFIACLLMLMFYLIELDDDMEGKELMPGVKGKGAVSFLYLVLNYANVLFFS